MAQTDSQGLAKILIEQEQQLVAEWMANLMSTSSSAAGDVRLADQCTHLLRSLRQAVLTGQTRNIQGGEWAEVRQLLTEICYTRARQGATPRETAIFVFALKQALFSRLRESVADPALLAAQTLLVSNVLDELGLFTIEVYQKGREEVIARQQQEMLELSTPVVQLWDDILALPLIGTLDSARTQVVMESLLQKIVETGASIAIVDITGVPTVDTLVAQHLLKTVAAARLMGADCIISGIRPQIAQTIVHLGVDLEDVVTKATLADAFAVALRKSGAAITRAATAR
ncbi:MAG: anti-anti-sigma factor [Betaproteobacteria bacterium]|nr:anti-anti-sigma factor [Betaproteobacteria bacterium]